MSFCKECGSKLQPGMQFCNECGTPVQTEEVGGSNDVAESRKKMPKKKKAGLITVGAVAVLLFGGYKTGEFLTDKDRMIEQFETALNSGDEAKVASMLHPVDSSLKVTKDNVKGFMNYYKKHPDDRKDLIGVLKSQSQYLDQRSAKTSMTASGEVMDELGQLVNLEKNGKKAFLFDNYELNVMPVYVTVGTDYKGTDIYLDDKKIGTAASEDFKKTYGPYLPGTYTIKGKLKTDFVDLVSKENVTFTSPDGKENVSLDLNGEEVSVDLGIDDTDIKGKLLIDGKDVGINPFKTSSFGPVVTDGSMDMQVSAELPWGKVTTNKVAIDSNEMVYDLGQSKELQETLINTIVPETKNLLSSYIEGTTSKLQNATPEYKETVNDVIADFKTYGTYLKDQYLGTTFDLDSTSLEYTDDGQWLATIYGEETHNSDTYMAGETPSLEKTAEVMEYQLIYDEKQKKWLIDNVEPSDEELSDNTKEMKEEKPATYQTKWKQESASSNEEKSSNEASDEEDDSQATNADDSAKEVTESDISSFMEEYMNATIDSINLEDFSYAEPYIDPNGKKYKEQKDYTAYLNKKNITEDLLKFTVTDIEKVDDNTFKVFTNEEYDIRYDDGSLKNKTFNSIHTVKYLSSGKLAVNELISSTEVK
ncbi:zinc-ribbon domain-containing protein [Priestia megaterium]|uniref:zinc ribbon domain-containing protein n=1 Tax=Priestia megaterium TaxID=1404 RepID=UPI00234F9C08|nr:zinc-ribbon domain-containing protein [Priestia megaterium]MDC7771467.1 zinc-ribbon domain-containing protein [Priestia megaterium]